MAGKKPAKPMAGQSRQVVQDPAIYGQPVKIYGSASAYSECAECGNKTIRGMVRVKGDKNYCSVRCATKN
jgi:hypothetical protein